MSYVVHGATGAQGGLLATVLKAAGRSVTAVTRKPGSAPDGVAAVVADYASTDSLAAAYRGADGVFVHLPLGSEDDRRIYARNIAAALAEARPGRVVISTSGQIIDDPGSPLQQPDDAAIQALVRGTADAGLSLAIIAPRLFLENLLLPPVVEGIRTEGVLRYPLRADFPVSWSSHLDNAEAAAALFDHSEIEGVVAVGQQPPITGPDLAEAFGARLGRDVRYESVTPDRFGEVITPLIGAAGAAGVVGLYSTLNGVFNYSFDPEGGAQARLGLKLRTPDQWLEAIGF